MASDVMDRFERLRPTLDKLQGHGIISGHSFRLLSDFHEALNKKLKSHQGSLQAASIRAYARKAVELTAAIEQIDQGTHNVDCRSHAACIEAVKVLGLPDETEVFILPSLKKAPRIYPLRDEHSMTLLIFQSRAVDMTYIPFIGLFYHEIAHAEPKIYQVCWVAKNSEDWKAGELLADVCALMMSGPLYAAAVPRYCEEVDRDVERPSRKHPSPVLRGEVMGGRASEIWTGELVTEVLDHLEPLDGAIPSEEISLRERVRTDIAQFITNSANIKIDGTLIYKVRQGEGTASPRLQLAADTGENE